MNCKRSSITLAAIIILSALMAFPAWAQTTLLPGGINVIKTAVEAAAPGTTFLLTAGVYTEDPFSIPDGVNIYGADRRTVTIQESASTAWIGGTAFIWVKGSNINLAGFTVQGRGVKAIGALPFDNSAKYGINLAGGLVTPVVANTNVTLTNITSRYFGGTGVNLNGATNVVLNKVESINNGGAGIYLSDSHYVTLNNITTNANTWGGVCVNVQGKTFPIGTSGIVFSGANSFGESGFGGAGLWLESDKVGNGQTTETITWSDKASEGAMVTIQASDFAYATPAIYYGTGEPTKRHFFASAADASAYLTPINNAYGTTYSAVALSAGTSFATTVFGQLPQATLETLKGAKGSDGASVQTASVDQTTGNLSLILSNSTSINAGNVKGPQGTAGLPGPTGPAGLPSINVPADYATLQAAITAAPNGSIIHVAPGMYIEAGQIVINKDLTIIGHGRPVIRPGSALSTWWQVTSGGALNLQNVVLDGSGQAVSYAIYGDGPGKVDNCAFVNIRYSDNDGIGIRAQGGNWTITNSTFKGMERIGAYFGPGVTDGVFSGNTYTGRGATPVGRLEYGVELGRGSIVTVANNTITGCRGIANPEDYSAGVYVDNYWTPTVPSKATLTNNIISDNYRGVTVGYKADPSVQDTSEVTAHYNQFMNNDLNIENVSSKALNFQSNSWGTADPAAIAASITNTLGSVDSSSPLQGQQGLKGEKGEKGETGAPGFTPVKGVNYFDGAAGQPGQDGSPDTPAQVVAKIATGGNVGIGIAASGRPLVVDSASNTLAAGNSSIILQGESNKERLEMRSFGPAGSFAPAFMGMGARGTKASPLAVGSGDILFLLSGFGWNGTAYGGTNPAANSGAASIILNASETHTTTAKGSYIDFQTTANGTTTRATKVRIGNDGSVGIGTTTPTQMLDVNGNGIRIRTSKTPATSTTSCNQGEMAWDAGFVYVCVATNTWKRSALAAW